MSVMLDPARLGHCRRVLEEALAFQRNPQGFWTGRLSSSALSTATAAMAFHVVRRETGSTACDSLIERGLAWLTRHQNADGGWGDTTDSRSNIATTLLCRAVLHAAGGEAGQDACRRAVAWIEAAGGTSALAARYGRDRTFSVPILTQCALAGLVEWSSIPPLPFELARVPARFYKFMRLPVVSYALPALVAMGQARHHHAPSSNPLIRGLRGASILPTLRILSRIQPESGGFLEATPLTSFVAMSLASTGKADHPVVQRALAFLLASVREDGSWPIDTNLSTWVTTLSINALEGVLNPEVGARLAERLLNWQLQEPHAYTNADPGGWAWTDLTGGVPDADDTAGALLALVHLRRHADAAALTRALVAGARWLLNLQNGDGGWPTFCRGWGALPFDRSAPDLTAHAMRALQAACNELRSGQWTPVAGSRMERSVARAAERGFRYLEKSQRADGAWVPLWFGNQNAPGEENPVFGTARVLAAYRDCARLETGPARAAMNWLSAAQNDDGGWGGDLKLLSSFEETAIALEALLSVAPQGAALDSRLQRGLAWLLGAIECEMWRDPSPIGLYFARLWYSEELYPVIFGVAALRRAAAHLELSP